MNEKLNIDWLLIRLENGELSPEEEKELKILIQTSPAHREAAALHQAYHQAFHDPEEKALYEQLKQIHQQVTLPKKRNTMLRIAAVVILLLGVAALILFIRPGKPPKQELYSQYFQPFPTPDQYRDPAISAENTATSAYLQYDKGDYKLAEPQFRLALKDDPANTALLFYLAICCLENQESDSALAHFQKIISLQDPIFSSPSRWYTSLCLIRSGEFLKAKVMLTALVSENGSYSSKARELLEKIK